MAADAPLLFVFNGDADGLCAQHIYALERGLPAARITGWKRDVLLASRIPARGPARIRVFDISLAANLEAVVPLLRLDGVDVEWYDHHDPGDPPAHPRLAVHVNQAAGVCTGTLVDAALGRRQPEWAAMAAYGDNLPATAEGLLASAGTPPERRERIARAGLLLNYNAYGDRPGDVLFEPADLAERMQPFRSARDFAAEDAVFAPLQARHDADRARFRDLDVLLDAASAQAFLVPDEPWARRYAATWSNERVRSEEGRSKALATLHPRPDGTYLVSLRAPRVPGKVPPTVSGLAREFPTGGGRALAGGINRLPAEDLGRFLTRFAAYFS
jgi:hypothetical protein